MGSKKFWSDWIFPIIAYFMFATLLATILIPTDSMTLPILIASSASPLAYSLILVSTFMASRPRFIEKHVGMPRMYEIHALMTIYAGVLVFGHITVFWQGLDNVFRNPATTWGYIGALGILLCILSGVFSLSGMFANKNSILRHLKENVLNREVMLWVHRITALMAIIGTYLQNVYIPFLRANTPYMVLLTFYTVATLGYYAYWKLKIFRSPKHRVTKIYKETPLQWVVEFEPVNGEVVEYTAGDYFFIRFKNADITGEAHPFSASSAKTNRYNNSIEFMIKEAGDWTRALENIEEGDIATLEGPYGDFFPEPVRESEETEIPFVLLAGGIGIPPTLSVLRHEMEKGSQREMYLVWGLAYEEDTFLVDELEEMKKINPNFKYHLIYSNEEVEGFPFGFITNEFLEEVGADKYRDGHFFVCGPEPMLDASRKLLATGNVSDEQIHLDDFGF